MKGPFLVISVLICGAHLQAAAPVAEANRAATLDVGVSVTLEGSAGLRAGNRIGQALHALTLARLDWEHPASVAAPTGLRAHASLLNHEGRGPTARFLGDFLAASNIEAFDSTRLYSWWFEADRAGWSLRLGALLADEEFAGTAAGGYLVNSAFGWPAFISANTVNTGPAFFVAAPGVRLARELRPGLVWRGGIYDGDTFDSSSGDPTTNRSGLRCRLGGAQGWFLINELAYAPEAGRTRFKAGVWHHTATFADQHLDATGRPFPVTGAEARVHPGNTGAYAALERTLAGVAGQSGHVDAFLRLGGAPRDRNPLAWTLDTGLAWQGPLPGRTADVAAVGFIHAQFSSRAAATARLLDPASPRLDAEQVIEASYTASVGDRLSLKPDVQYIRHPGGNATSRAVLLVMLRANLEF